MTVLLAISLMLLPVSGSQILLSTDSESESSSISLNVSLKENSILGITGPGGLADSPSMPSIRIPSDYDLDQDGDVDDVDLLIHEQQQSWEKDPRFNMPRYYNVLTEVPVDPDQRIVLDSKVVDNASVLRSHLDETPFSWVWHSRYTCCTSKVWSQRNSLMYGHIFTDKQECINHYYACKAEEWVDVDVTRLKKPAAWPAELTIKELFRYGMWPEIEVTYQNTMVTTIGLSSDGWKIYGALWPEGLIVSHDTLLQIEPMSVLRFHAIQPPGAQVQAFEVAEDDPYDKNLPFGNKRTKISPREFDRNAHE